MFDTILNSCGYSFKNYDVTKFAIHWSDISELSLNNFNKFILHSFITVPLCLSLPRIQFTKLNWSATKIFKLPFLAVACSKKVAFCLLQLTTKHKKKTYDGFIPPTNLPLMNDFTAPFMRRLLLLCAAAKLSDCCWSSSCGISLAFRWLIYLVSSFFLFALPLRLKCGECVVCVSVFCHRADIKINMVQIFHFGFWNARASAGQQPQ